MSAGSPLTDRQSSLLQQAPPGSNVQVSTRPNPLGGETTNVRVERPDGTYAEQTSVTQDGSTSDRFGMSRNSDGSTELTNYDEGVSYRRNPDGSMETTDLKTGSSTSTPPPAADPDESGGEGGDGPGEQDPAEPCQTCGAPEAPPETSLWDDLWSFGKGVVEGLVMGVAAIGLTALVAAASPFWGTVLAVGLLAWGVYSAYEAIRNWGSMSRGQKLETVGGVVGGVLAGGVMRPKVPAVTEVPPERLPPGEAPPEPPPEPPPEEPPPEPPLRTTLEVMADIQGIIKGGEVDYADFKKLVPPGAVDTWKPGPYNMTGEKYVIKTSDGKVTLKWHSPDPYALENHPDSPSGKVPTAQFEIKKTGSPLKYMGNDGNLYEDYDAHTHIPIKNTPVT